MPSPFRSLRHPNYRLYFFGQGVSLVGSWMQTTTLAWLAWEWTRQSQWPAYLLVAQIAPTLFLGSWAGALADRVPKLGLVKRTQCAFLFSASLMTAFIAAGIPNIWALLALALLHGIVQSIDLPARLTFVPGLVDKADIPNAVALNSMQFNLARALGPALAGTLLSFLEPWVCLLVNTLSYIAVLFSLFLMKDINQAMAQPSEGRSKEGGWQYLRHYPSQRLVILLAGFVSVCGWPMLSLLPGYAELVLGLKHRGYGMLLSSVGVGALTSAFLLAAFGTEARRRMILLGGVSLCTSGIFALANVDTLPLACLSCGLFGFGMIGFLATGQAFVQMTVDDANRGKVMGVWAMMVASGVPAGNLLWGPLADAVGVTRVMTMQAWLMCVAVAALALRRRNPPPAIE